MPPPTPEATFGLIGVALGFLLSFASDFVRRVLDRRRQRRAIKKELKTNLYMLPQKLNTINNMKNAIDDDFLLPGSPIRFIYDAYRSNITSVASYMSAKEIASLHVVYEYMRVVDDHLDSYAETIASSLGTDQQGYRIAMGKAMLNDLPHLIELTETLLIKHLDGQPHDVLYLSQPYSDVKNLPFTRQRGAA